MIKTDINKGRLLGAHCSIAGGLYTAAERGGKLGCSAIQIFTKNSNQWKAEALTLSDIDSFKEALSKNSIRVAFAHAGYLINLSTVEPEGHANSMKSMNVELERAIALELSYVVVHPGSHKEAGELVGIMQLVENLKILREEVKGAKVQIILETTAGQGSCLGYRFEHFSEVFDRLGWPADIGICVDTAHLFQAGYDISSREGYMNVIKEFDEVVGLDYIRVFHINDSKTECGSHVDRHQHIGKGKIGEEAFKLLLNDERFRGIPMVLETPKNKNADEDNDNLNLLRSFIKR
jgi:deoxyribonuclease-4